MDEESTWPYADEYSVTATEILEHLFCPRFTYFEIYLGIPEHQEKRFKVQTGRSLHEEKSRINPRYLREKLKCIDRKNRVYLSSARGIRGIVDEVLFFSDGSAAPLDYKYAQFRDRTFKSHQMQLTFYGRLIRDHYGLLVYRGFIVYTRSRNKLVEVPLTEQMYKDLEREIEEILKIVRRGFYPKPTPSRLRCSDCCYRNICESVI